MAKKLSELISIAPSAGTQRNYDNLRDRFLYAFHMQATSEHSGNWGSYFGDTGVTDGRLVNPTRNVWKVPAGISLAKFELWGAGGGGAGSSCCMQGISGGSGAYAYKEISVTPGDRYVLCLGDYSEYCCTNRCGAGSLSQGCLRKQTGYRGPSPYVKGNGIGSNFCAEGGNPGVSAFCPMFNMHDRTPESDGRKCCCYCWTVCDLYAGGPTGQYRALDSANEPMRVATYYGADGGVNGSRGYIRTSCCGLSANADACGIHHAIPYPGGLWNREDRGYRGGVVEVGANYCCHCCGPANFQLRQAQGTLNSYSGFGGHDNVMTGMGGPTAFTVDGATNCCGSRGGPSAIWISYC